MPQLLKPRALEPVRYKRRHHSEKPARCHQTIAGAAMKTQHSQKYIQVFLKKEFQELICLCCTPAL